jgi:nicotinamidase-related amidase
MKPRVPFKNLSRATPPFRVTKENAALLLVDFQRFATQRDEGLGQEAQQRGILREFEEYYAQVDAALCNVQRLLAGCREHGLPVIHTLLHSDPVGGRNLSRQLEVSGLPLPTGAPEDEIRPEVTPLPSEVILPRGTYSPFAGTNLLSVLREKGVDTVVLAGMLANITAALTALEAADRDFGVIWVWDASASESLYWHEITKTGLVGPLLRIRTAQQVTEMMEGTRT